MMIARLLIICASLQTVSAFSAAAPKPFLEGLTSFFNNQGAGPKHLDLKRQSLKADLLELCRNTEEKASRSEVEDIIGELRGLQQMKDTAKSELLQKEWLL